MTDEMKQMFFEYLKEHLCIKLIIERADAYLTTDIHYNLTVCLKDGDKQVLVSESVGYVPIDK